MTPDDRSRIDAYLEMKSRGFAVSKNFLWAMYAGLLGVDFHKIPPEFKDVVNKQLASASQ